MRFTMIHPRAPFGDYYLKDNLTGVHFGQNLAIVDPAKDNGYIFRTEALEDQALLKATFAKASRKVYPGFFPALGAYLKRQRGKAA